MAEPWWQDAFTADYLTLYAHRSDEAAAAEVAAVVPRLRSGGGPVLDACCGNGRHVQALRAAGLTVLGFDWSSDLLAAASRRAAVRGRVCRSDVRRPACAGGFGAVTLFFTAFGYFDEADNAATLAALARLLRPGGWLLIDLPEPAHLTTHLVPESRRRAPDGRELVERRGIAGRRVVKTVELYRDGLLERHYQERVRLYTVEEMRSLAGQAGLTLVDRWPGLFGARRDEHRNVFWLQAVVS